MLQIFSSEDHAGSPSRPVVKTRNPHLPLATDLPSRFRRSSSSSDLKLEPRDPSVTSGNVRPPPKIVESFEGAGESSKAVRDEAGGISPLSPPARCSVSLRVDRRVKMGLRDRHAPSAA